jgi:hypothetical protein
MDSFSALSMLASASHEGTTKKRPNTSPEMQPQKRIPRIVQMREPASGYPMAMPSMNDILASQEKVLGFRNIALDNLIVASPGKKAEAPILSKTNEVARGVLRKCFNEFAHPSTGAMNQHQLRSVDYYLAGPLSRPASGLKSDVVNLLPGISSCSIKDLKTYRPPS